MKIKITGVKWSINARNNRAKIIERKKPRRSLHKIYMSSSSMIKIDKTVVILITMIRFQKR